GLVTDVAGQDGTAVDEDGGKVQTGGGHEHAGQRLVAAGEGDHAVEALGVHHRLDRVADDLARDEGRPHALVTHGDAVGDGDGHELDGETAGRADSFFGALGQA